MRPHIYVHTQTSTNTHTRALSFQSSRRECCNNKTHASRTPMQAVMQASPIPVTDIGVNLVDSSFDKVRRLLLRLEVQRTSKPKAHSMGTCTTTANTALNTCTDCITYQAIQPFAHNKATPRNAHAQNMCLCFASCRSPNSWPS